MAFEYIFLFFDQIGHYWMPKRLSSKNSDQLPILNRLTDIFVVGKFDYGVMVRYQNLMRTPELFRAPLGPGTTYPLNPLLAGPVYKHWNACANKTAVSVSSLIKIQPKLYKNNFFKKLIKIVKRTFIQISDLAEKF